MSKKFEDLFIIFVKTLDAYGETNVARWEKYDFHEYKSKSFSFQRNLKNLENCFHEYLLELLESCDEETSCVQDGGEVK